MPIKNYTTEIDAFRSIGEIQGILASHGATKIKARLSAPPGGTYATGYTHRWRS